MSVLVSKRKESKFEVIVFSEELRNQLTRLMQRGFGIKNIENYVRLEYAYGKLKTEDVEYYRSVMQCSKAAIHRILLLLTNNLRAANSIYPTSMAEYEQRRMYQNAAIVNCEQIIKELQHIINIFNVDINLYRDSVSAIDRQIRLIKEWRQRDNRIKKRLNGSV